MRVVDLFLLALLASGFVLLSITGIAHGTWGYDAYAYWAVDPAHPYDTLMNVHGAYLYAPVFLPITTVFGWLPYGLYLAGWTAILLLALAWLGRGFGAVLFLVPFVALEILAGNINLLLAVALVVGMSRPAAWSFVLLTKPTCGVGLLWFAARREWRSLAIALGTTLVLVSVSLVVLPGAWRDWISLLLESGQRPPVDTWLPIPIWLRLPAAGALVWWGGRTDRPWTIAAAVTLALPVVWFAGLAILVAALRIESRAAVERRAAPMTVLDVQRTAASAT